MNNVLALPQYKCTTLQLAVIISFLAIFSRLFYLQIWCHNNFLHKSEKNFTRHATITPQRGNILDCNGNLLVTNKPITNISWRGTGNYRLSLEQQNMLSTLQEILDCNINDTVQRKIRSLERHRKEQLIFEDISLAQLSTIMEQFPEHPNIIITSSFKRYYPYQTVACHILGYINQLQDTGQMGLEKLFDEVLRGEHGQFIKTINSTGRSLSITPLQNAIGGADITTTLDMPLQMIAEQIFPKDEAGTLIIMDPATGALRVVLSHPAFDPSVFIEGIDYDSWNKLSEKKPFINRAFNGCYPPASIFKLVTIAAALEENIIDTDTAWYCKGYIRYGRRTRCNKQHGWVDVQDAIAQSCNIPFYEIGKRMPIDTLATYAQQFGLGQKTGVLFPENRGLVPTTEWKMERIGQRWWPGETLSATIGQSYLLVTPLQIATMISSIVTGNRTRPCLLPQETPEHIPLEISYETRRFLQKAMRQVVKVGKAKTLNDIEDIKMYAKTGTAQTTGLGKRHLGKQFKSHAWLAGYFKYKDAQPLTIVILLECTGSSRTATRVAKRFLIKYRDWAKDQEELYV